MPSNKHNVSGQLPKLATCALAGAAVLMLVVVFYAAWLPSHSSVRPSAKRREEARRIATPGARALTAGAGGTRYLVVSSSSCEDIVPPKPWLRPPSQPPYDVLLFDYSANNSCAQYFPSDPSWFRLLHRPKTFKWPAVHSYFTTDDGRLALTIYDYVLVADDDVDFRHAAGGSQPDSLLSLLEICAAAGAYICQPSLSARSSGLFATTFSVPHGSVVAHSADLFGGGLATAYLRESEFVEQMLPAFCAEALGQFLPHFRGLTHAWGIDALWSDAATRLGRRIAIVDSVQVDHMRPSGVSGLYRRIGGLEAARRDQEAFKARFGIRDTVFAAANTAGGGAELAVAVPAAVLARAQPQPPNIAEQQ